VGDLLREAQAAVPRQTQPNASRVPVPGLKAIAQPRPNARRTTPVMTGLCRAPEHHDSQPRSDDEPGNHAPRDHRRNPSLAIVVT